MNASPLPAPDQSDAPSDTAPRVTPGPAGRLPTPGELTAITEGRLPGLLGFTVTQVAATVITAQMDIQAHHLAPNGYLHAATVVTLADTACGMGCRLTLPEGASGFTTLELKTSYLRTVRNGTVGVHASLVHGGRSTQVWDATVADENDRVLALFRCTQLILWPK
ncbi:PaaI family thioesterase [Streptomyces sp. NPDC020802]|uniref:PaaI family thioesterase n=1 Tax=Streptomyces sp. NPDC020802 TaxID=3365094 RepID=UPI003797D452